MKNVPRILKPIYILCVCELSGQFSEFDWNLNYFYIARTNVAFSRRSAEFVLHRKQNKPGFYPCMECMISLEQSGKKRGITVE